MGDILKEAIADAKAVRETALENAKMALEEAFTPQLKSMLSAKLKEDEFDEWDEEKENNEEEKSKYCFTRDKIDKILKVHDYLESLFSPPALSTLAAFLSAGVCPANVLVGANSPSL